MRMSGEDMANSSCMAVPSGPTPFTEDAWKLPPGSLLASLYCQELVQTHSTSVGKLTCAECRL